MQDFLGIPLAIENPSTYLEFNHSHLSEAEFIAHMVRATDCNLLLDVNNVYVTSFNHHLDPKAYIDALPLEKIIQIHLSGHDNQGTHIIDTHDNHVEENVWRLYQYVVHKIGYTPNTMIEWDNRIPEFPELLAELNKARLVAKEAGNFAPLSRFVNERDTAAIIFLDLRGFTQASASFTPNALIELLEEYQGLVVPILRQHGGNIDKFMGDGILASFGAVSPNKSYAADVLRAVDDLQIAAQHWSKERASKGLSTFSIGAGIAVGDVVFGVIGFEDRLEYTVIGETVNLAAKLEKQNKVEQARALATIETLQIAQRQGYQQTALKEIRRSRTVGGVSQPMDIVVLA